MFLATSKNSKTGRTFLSIKKGYRDSNGKTRQITVKTIGFLDELPNKYPEVKTDYISYFRELASKMTDEENNNQTINISINLNDPIPENSCNRFNYGSIALSSIFHELELNEFFTNRAKYRKFSFLPNKVMQLLTYARILYPSSKIGSFENKNKFFDIEHDKDHIIDIQHIYRTLDFIHPLKEDLISWINTRIDKLYNRDTSIMYYDVTNYYFESDRTSSLREQGHSKENKTTPIIQMGLAIDNIGLPVTYKLFSGNTHDAKTYDNMLLNIKKDYNSEKIIIVADRGLNSGDNIAHTTIENNGYIFGQSVKKLSKEEIDYVFDANGFIEKYDENNNLVFKSKSRVIDKKIKVSTTYQKSKKSVELTQKQVVFFSAKYANRTKKQRALKLEKANKIINNPSLYDKTKDKGAFAYIKNAEIDKTTGELITNNKKILSIDESRIKEEEKFDGYYMIITSETKMNDSDIISAYHGLWKIEETFKVTKLDLETRPIYLSNDNRIEAHFMMCYISLVILRILQYKTDNKYSCTKLINELKNIECTLVDENKYLFNYRSEITDEISKVLNIDFSKKWMRKSDINATYSNLRK